LNELHKEEVQNMERLEIRLRHLEECPHPQSSNPEALTRWNNLRLARLLIDYMLREGFVTD